MIFEVSAIAAAVVQFLAPFTPFLLDVGKSAGTKLAETLGEKGGEAAWNKASTLWQKISDHFGEDSKVQTAAAAVAMDPDDADFLKKLAKTLADRLETAPN